MTQKTLPGRLEEALKHLGYANAKALHHKSNLVHAIELFAGVAGDSELVAECECEIQRIRAEVAAQQQRTDAGKRLAELGGEAPRMPDIPR